MSSLVDGIAAGSVGTLPPFIVTKTNTHLDKRTIKHTSVHNVRQLYRQIFLTSCSYPLCVAKLPSLLPAVKKFSREYLVDALQEQSGYR